MAVLSPILLLRTVGDRNLVLMGGPERYMEYIIYIRVRTTGFPCQGVYCPLVYFVCTEVQVRHKSFRMCWCNVSVQFSNMQQKQCE